MEDRRTAMTPEEFLQTLDAVIAKYSMLNSRFYQAWNKGQLSSFAISEYAKQRVPFEKMFATWVSAVHSRCGDDFTARRLLLENLIAEEMGPDDNLFNPWHYELWLQFGDGCGIARDEMTSCELLPETVSLTETFKDLTCNRDYRIGIAALYAYESQEHEVAKTKSEGLQKHYGISDSRTLETFTVHQIADVEHSMNEAAALAASCMTYKQQQNVLHAAETAAAALLKFLDGVYEAYGAVN